MAVALVRSETWTGMELLLVELLPGWPEEFAPQHLTAPLLKRAQVCPPPAVMAWTCEQQPLEQGMSLLLQVYVHVPMLHTGWALATEVVQVLPHAPQLFGSVCKSTHVLLQQVVEPEQATFVPHIQAPPAQLSAVAELQAPQLSPQWSMLEEGFPPPQVPLRSPLVQVSEL